MSDLFSNKVCCCVHAVQDPHVWTILWIKIISLMMNHLSLSVVCSIEFSYVIEGHQISKPVSGNSTANHSHDLQCIK